MSKKGARYTILGIALYALLTFAGGLYIQANDTTEVYTGAVDFYSPQYNEIRDAVSQAGGTFAIKDEFGRAYYTVITKEDQAFPFGEQQSETLLYCWGEAFGASVVFIFCLIVGGIVVCFPIGMLWYLIKTAIKGK